MKTGPKWECQSAQPGFSLLAQANPSDIEKIALESMNLLRKLLPAFALTALLCGSSAGPETLERKVEWGDERYIEWQVGEAPIVISIPHGGGLRPFECSSRTWGKTARDGHTIEIGLKLRDAIIRETGKAPHIVICHLHRSKLDANRETEEAAQGGAVAELAWSQYHGFIEQARTAGGRAIRTRTLHRPARPKSSRRLDRVGLHDYEQVVGTSETRSTFQHRQLSPCVRAFPWRLDQRTDEPRRAHASPGLRERS